MHIQTLSHTQIIHFFFLEERKLCLVIQNHPSPRKVKRWQEGCKWERAKQTEQIQSMRCDASSCFFPPISGPHGFPADCVRESHLLPSRPTIPLPGCNFPSCRPTSWLPPLRYLGNHGQWQIICLCGMFTKRSLPCRGTEQDASTFPLSKHSKWVLQPMRAAIWWRNTKMGNAPIKTVLWVCMRKLGFADIRDAQITRLCQKSIFPRYINTILWKQKEHKHRIWMWRDDTFLLSVSLFDLFKNVIPGWV